MNGEIDEVHPNTALFRSTVIVSDIEDLLYCMLGVLFGLAMFAYSISC